MSQVAAELGNFFQVFVVVTQLTIDKFSIVFIIFNIFVIVIIIVIVIVIVIIIILISSVVSIPIVWVLCAPS